MDQCHWAINSSTAGQDIPRTLCTQNLPYRIYTSPSYAYILSQINPIQVTALHLISTVILCSSICQSLQFVSFFRVSPENIYAALFCPWRSMLQPPSTSWSENRNSIWWGAQIVQHLNKRISPPCCYFNRLRHKYFPSDYPQPMFFP